MREYQLTLAHKTSRKTIKGKVFRFRRLRFSVQIPELADEWTAIGEAGMVTAQQWIVGNGVRAFLMDIAAIGNLAFGPQVPQHIIKMLPRAKHTDGVEAVLGFVRKSPQAEHFASGIAEIKAALEYIRVARQGFSLYGGTYWTVDAGKVGWKGVWTPKNTEPIARFFQDYHPGQAELFVWLANNAGVVVKEPGI